MSSAVKKRLILTAKVLLVVGILSYLFYDVGKDGKLQELWNAPKQWGWVLIGFLACLGANLFAFVRWQLMVRALGLPFSLFDSIRIGLIGLFFGLFAFGVVGGDTLRAFYVTRRVKNRVSEAVTSVLADRLIGLLTMFMIATIAFQFFDPSSLGDPSKAAGMKTVGWVVTALTLIGCGGMGILFFTPWVAKTPLYQRITSLPKLGNVLLKLTQVIALYRARLGTIASAFVLSVGVNVCFAVSIFSLSEGLTQGNPTFVDHFTIEPIAMVSNAVPVPGGIGTMEMAMKYLYLSFGSQNGVIIGFAFRFALLSISAIGAVIWFLNREQVASVTSEVIPNNVH